MAMTHFGDTSAHPKIEHFHCFQEYDDDDDDDDGNWLEIDGKSLNVDGTHGKPIKPMSNGRNIGEIRRTSANILRFGFYKILVFFDSE